MRGRGVSGRRRRLRPVHRPRIDRRLAPSAAVEQRPIKDGARWRSVRFWWFPGGGMCCGRMYAGQIDFRQPRRSGGQGDLNFRWTTRHRSLHLCGPRWAGEEILATNQSTRFYYTIAVFRDMQPTRRLDTPRANDIVMTEVEGQTLVFFMLLGLMVIWGVALVANRPPPLHLNSCEALKYYLSALDEASSSLPVETRQFLDIQAAACSDDDLGSFDDGNPHQ
jgi:hypothetical protein